MESKHDSPICGMCAALKRTINRNGYVWRICSKCDDGDRRVSRNDSDGGTATAGSR